MAAGFLTTPRQQRNVYIHSRVAHDVTAPDYIFNAESDQDALPEFVGIVQATLDDYDEAYGNTIDVDSDPEDETHQVLTYNPITDEYDIKPGQYVL